MRKVQGWGLPQGHTQSPGVEPALQARCSHPGVVTLWANASSLAPGEFGPAALSLGTGTDVTDVAGRALGALSGFSAQATAPPTPDRT